MTHSTAASCRDHRNQSLLLCSVSKTFKSQCFFSTIAHFYLFVQGSFDITREMYISLTRFAIFFRAFVRIEKTQRLRIDVERYYSESRLDCQVVLGSIGERYCRHCEGEGTLVNTCLDNMPPPPPFQHPTIGKYCYMVIDLLFSVFVTVFIFLIWGKLFLNFSRK